MHDGEMSLLSALLVNGEESTRQMGQVTFGAGEGEGCELVR